MRKILALSAALLVSQAAMSQSDYGWFTGKASAFLGAGNRVGVSYHQMYNVSDRLACGMGLGLGSMAESRSVSLPIMGSLKVGLAERRKYPMMPVIHVSGGYAAGAGDFRGLYVEERIGLESTKIARIRYSVDLGCAHIHNSTDCWMLAVGVLF